jgi:glyoxylase-like metal-dependent hydrolase (beta-lactamase superfamily II)
MKTDSIDVAPGVTLDLIDLPLSLEGYHHFFGIWLLRDENRGLRAIVDTGPSSTVPLLLESLKKHGVTRLDYILLTHIHLDHSGGLAEVLEAFPTARVAVHPKGKRHLVNPERLWQSSLEVIPDMAAVYGEPASVDEGVFLPEPLDVPGVESIDTPGHAPHHRSFVYRAGNMKILFAGEAASTYGRRGHAYPGEDDGTFFLRPATPPKFFLGDALESIARLEAVNADVMCYAHFGYTRETAHLLNEARKQLLLWQDLFKDYLAEEKVVPEDVKIEDLLEFILRKDPWLAELANLPEDMQRRERGFLLSSTAGFLGAVTD